MNPPAPHPPPPPPLPSAPTPGEEKTVLVPRREIDAELPRGERIAQYVIEERIGVGGHGIVYRARDTGLQRTVAIKEYMPATLATRTADGRVVPRLPRYAEAFDLGLKSFLNEAKLLAFFDHPALIKVHQYWPENGTAYMATTLIEGVTLRKWLVDRGAPPSEGWLRALALELVDVLALLHEQQCYHRDIAPDNILLRTDGKSPSSGLEPPPRPLLLDFGSARRVIGEATQQLTALLKPGYSPPEQYEGETSARQGPWTDVYALAAVLYAAVTGAPPPSSIARVINDEMLPATIAGAGRYSPQFLSAIDAALAVRPEHRLRSMAEFKARLEEPYSAPDPDGVVPAVSPRDLAAVPTGPAAWPWFAAAGAVALVMLSVWWLRR